MVKFQDVEGCFTANNPQDLPSLVPGILEIAGDCKVWLLEGPMGAGKTTIIQAICKNFGVIDMVNSPTYALVNEYRNAQNRVFYHFDFYRLKNVDEARDIGCQEYFYSGDLCFIEWGSKVGALIPEQHLIINIQVQPDDSRKIIVEKHG